MTAELSEYRLFREALEDAAVAVLLLDRDLRLQLANRAAHELFDVQGEAWIGRSSLDLVPANRRDLLGRLLRHVLLCDHEHKLYLNLQRPDKPPLKVAVHLRPLHDDQAKPCGVAAWIVRAQAREALDRELLRSVEMGALRELAGAMAHHFSSLLGGMITSIEFALASRDSMGYRRTLERVGQAANRASELIRQLQVFARAQRPDTHMADLTEVVLFISEAIEPDLAEQGIRLELQLAPIDAHAVPRQSMLEVLRRLTANAREAMPKAGTLRITLRQTDRDVVLRVRDTGPGISPEHLDRLFEPFFTTKGELGGGVGHNPGLGLAVVHGLVSEIGGTINVQSTPGQGAVFEIRLPRRPPGQPPPQPTHPESPDPPSPPEPRS